MFFEGLALQVRHSYYGWDGERKYGGIVSQYAFLPKGLILLF
jgi:hypothetical protein